VNNVIAILEDDPARVSLMRACLNELIPKSPVMIFEDASVMIEWLAEHQAEVVLISLDHDLPVRRVEGQVIDCGTGREVVDFLATLEPTCPVIVHSSNVVCGDGMMFALKDAGWMQSRVYPRDDLDWVREAWVEEVRRYKRDGWIVA
jgi:CheY-like chemotaxis protein